jgi:hypothetical protein
MRNIAAYTGIPVKLVTTALPPRSSWLPTRMFVTNAKSIKTRWATVPYLVFMISRYVWHLGAFCLTLQARIENMRI